MIGKTVSHYRILEKIGAGGMGEVYKAEDLKLKRTVALKFLPSEFTRDDEAKERFIREAQAASSLQHANICTIHDIDKAEDGRLFICMDCYEGETLKDKIKDQSLSDSGMKTGLKIDEIVDLAIQIAQGLIKAHEKGIVHRDIKPANIFITQDEVVKILDFGLAKLAAQTKVTKTGSTLGTVSYMSPEQTKGEEADHRSDIWSLGIVMYEMITGQLPFKGDYEQAIVYSILNDEAEPMRKVRNELPMELDLVVRKAMQKDSKERYENLQKLLVDLNSLKKKLEANQTEDIEKPLPSIAVLPFVNMSADPENEYFSDGLAEDLINALSKIKEFRVSARTSTFSFKGEKIDVREIGGKLKVETVLEGSVRKAGNRLRITAQLINVRDGYHLWSEQYDRVMDDVFDIQDEITLAIVDALKVELLAGENQAVMKRYTQNVEAYNLYLQGRYYWNKMNIEAFRKSIDYFQRAVETDPTYALAYAGLADSYTGLGDAGLSAIPPKEAFSNAMEAVQKALEIDDALAEAHASLAHLKMHDFDWSGTEQEFKRAIELNPNYATTYHMFAFYFALMERHDESIATIKRALELDPVSLGIKTDLGVLFYFARQYDQAIAQYHKTLEMDPGFVRAYVTLGSAYGQKGMYQEAIDMVQKAIDLSGDHSKIAALGRVYALSGKKDEARKVIAELKALANQRYISPYCFALIYASLGEKDQAINWLQSAYKNHVSELIYMKVDPYLDKLRSDPRFTALLKKVGLVK
jgi:serine/threonine protein kinase/Tfp pilus assembly protein PilF